jgi:hypothetical protein
MNPNPTTILKPESTTQIQPAIKPAATQVQPAIKSAATQVQPAIKPTTTIVKPTTTIVKPAIQIVPNELKITINTSVPGFQTIKYNSSMTIKDKNKNQVCFNPLVKLDKNVIEKIPKEIRISEFFNKGMFESLINMHGMTKEKTLKDATQKGYVDNNIRVTLDTIFSTGSVIYINKEPYAIADVQWTNGDWKIDTKEKPVEFDTSKITNPQMYANIIKEEIKTGETQLEDLQKSTPGLLSGPSYTGPPVVTVVPVAPQTAPQTAPQIAPQIAPQVASNTDSSTAVVPFKPPSVVPSTAVVPFKPPQVVPSTAVVPFKGPSSNTVSNTAIVPAVPAASEVVEEIDSDAEEENQEQPQLPMERLPECLLPYPRGKYEPTALLREYFGNTNYYNLVNQIFLRMNAQTKQTIRDYLKGSTTIGIDYSVETLSRAAYTKLIEGMRISINNGGGDCLFLAVASAINCYNHKYPGNTIKSGIYGKKRINFTQLQLRELVYEYLISNKGNLQNKQVIVDADIEGLNARFLQELIRRDYGTSEFNLTDDDYLDLVNNTYVSLPNFLVIKPTIVPVLNSPEYTAPFTNSININNREQLRDYILSNQYWGNEESLNALCDKLKINIITIHYNPDAVNLSEQFRISSGNLLTSDACNDWSKFLFLYESNNHYELITFTYTTKIPSSNPKKQISFVNSSETHVIFNNDYIILPPIFILFFIYGSKYVSRESDNLDAKLLPDIFNSINNSFEEILRENNRDTIIFLNSFNTYFTSNKILRLIQQIEAANVSRGGANFEKKEEKKDASKICYYITIDMELQKGTSLSEEQLSDAKCRQKWNAVRKAYANFTGKKYVIPPVYETSKNKTQKQSLKTSTNTSTNTINKSYRNNKTKKYNSSQVYQGGKQNRTIKNR